MAVTIINSQVVSFAPVTQAKVGQTIVVEEIDENGRPIRWKAADLSSNVITVAESEVETFDPTAYPPGTVFVLYSDELPEE